MPPMDGEGEYDGASGPSSSMDAEGRELGLRFLARRPRSHSTSPPSSQKIVTDLAPRSVSPGPTMKHGQDGFTAPRRLSLSRFSDSPTAVPLHFRPPPTSPRLQHSPSINSPTAASPGSPSQGRRSRPNSAEFKHSREIRPLFLVERHGSNKMENQLGDEPLPSLPSSKSASTEDLTVLPDENTWESAEHSRQVQYTGLPTAEPYSQHEVLGSQQNTPTRATFGPPHHLSRKQELGYEFHSPSELLQESSTYGDLPSSPAMEVLSSAESSTAGVKEERHLARELESLPALPDSRPATPDDKAISAWDVQQQTTPTQEKSLPVTDTPDFHSGPGFAGVVDAAVAAAHPDTAPYPDAEVLAKSQHYDAEDDDTVRTITGDDVPAVEDADATPPGSPIKEREYHDSFADRAAPWGFASVVGAAVAANKGAVADEGHHFSGDFPVTTPSGDEKTPSVADTTEDEFFDAMSRDEVGDEDEAAWDLNLPAKPAEPVVLREVSEVLGGQNRELESQSAPVPEPELDIVKTEEPSMTEQGPTEPVPEVTDKSIDEAIEAQPDVVDASTSSTKKKNKKKKKGKNVDVTDQGEDKAPETQTIDPAPITFGEDEKKDEAQTPTPEQVQVGEIPAVDGGIPEQIVESERKLSVDTEDNFEDAETHPVPEVATPALDEAVTMPEQSPTTDLERPIEENRFIPVDEPLTTEQPTEEIAPEVTAETTETSKAVDAEPTQPEEPEETASDAGLSKKAKKKKKAAKAKAAAAAAAAVAEESAPAEELTAQTEDAVASQRAEPEVSKENLEPTDSTRPIEDVTQPAEQPEGLVIEKSLQPTEAVEGVYAPPEGSLGRVPEDISPERELTERAVSAEHPATESEQVYIPGQETQESSTTADIAAPADAEPLPESDKPDQEADAPLSRKASKKDKKKKKRKSAVEVLSEAETADTQPEPEPSEKLEGVERELPLGEGDSKIKDQEDISADFKEPVAEAVKNEEVAPEPAPDTVTVELAEPAGEAIEAAEESKQQEQDGTLEIAKDIPVGDAVPEELEEEGSTKKSKKKKKKNRKSTSVSEQQPEPEPEMKPEDITSQPETSGPPPPLDDTQQHEADTKDEPTGTQTVGTISEQAEGEPSQSVELPETNDSEPHVPEQPTIEPEAGEQTSTGKKSKKKEDEQNVPKELEETSLPDIVGGPEASEPSIPATEADPDGPNEAPIVPDEPSPTPGQDPTEEMSREVETAAESGNVAIPDSQDAAGAPPMTAAQKKKAKKEKKKKERQSLLLGELETPGAAAVAEKELTDAPPQEPIQEPKIAKTGIEQPEVVTPNQQEAVSKAIEQENEPQSSERFNEQVAEKISEQLGDELAATEPPSPEATETVPVPAQDTTTGDIAEEPPTTEGVEAQEDKPLELGAPAVPEAPIEPVSEDAQPVQSESTRDIGGIAVTSSRTDDQPDGEQLKENVPSDVNATTIEPTEDIQQQTTEETQAATESVPETPTEETQPTSKKDKKKKKKKRQSGSVETEPEAEATSAKEEDIAPVMSTELPTSHAPVTVEDTSTEYATKEGEVTESQPGPTGTMEELQETEKVEELPVPTEAIRQAPVEQNGSGSQDRSIPELPTEEASLAEVPTPVHADTQEQEQLAEETEASSSKKKNKKKKKKSQTTSVDEDKPAPEPEEPVSEKPAEPVTETALTTEPEEAPVVPTTATAVEETQPTDETPTPEPKELESQDLPPAEEEPKASKKKAKKDKKKRKSVSFAAEETPEQQPEPSEPVEHADPAEVKKLEPTEILVETEAAGEQKEVEVQERELEPAEPSEIIPNPVPEEISVAGESKQNEEAPAEAETLGEPESADKALDHSNRLTADLDPSEDVVDKETDYSLPAKESAPVAEAETMDDFAKQPQSVEPEAAGQAAEAAEPEMGSSKKKDKKKKKRKTLESKEDGTTASPEPSDNVHEQVEAITAAPEVKEIEEPVQEPAEEPAPEPQKQEEDEPKSAKAKKKAKKDKKRQSKLLALESEPSTPTETTQDAPDDKPLDPEVAAEEVPLETSKEQQPTTLGTDAPAETEISPAEDDGKENQSHDTEHHGDNDKDLTWTDNDMSSQVEKEQQPTVSTDPLSEHKVESEQVEALTPENKVVGEGQEASAKLEPSEDTFTEEKIANEIEVVKSEEVGEVQDETKQTENNRALEEETAVEHKKTDDNDIPANIPEATNTMGEREEEEIALQPAIEDEPVKEAEADQPTADVHREEPESAIPSRKLSKKQKKKQRQAEKAAALQEPEQEPTPETESVNPVTLEEAKPEPAVSEEVEVKTTVTGDSVPEEHVTEVVPEDRREVSGLETADDHSSEVTAPEAVQGITSIPEDGVPQDEPSRDIDEDTQEAAGLSTIGQQQPEHAAPESTHDTTPLPIAEDIAQQTKQKSPAVEEGILNEESAALGTRDVPVMEETPEKSVAEELATGKGKKKNKKKASIQTADASEVTQFEEPPVTGPETAVQTDISEDVPEVQIQDAPPSRVTQDKYQPDVAIGAEELPPQPQTADPTESEATKEQQLESVPETAFETPAEDKSLEEHADEPILSRKGPKKQKKKAKKQAKEQEQLEEAAAPGNVETEAEEHTNPADVVEAESLPAVEAVAVAEDQGSQDEPTEKAAPGPLDDERKSEMAPEEAIHEEAAVKTRNAETTAGTDQADVSREVLVQENMENEVGSGILLEEKMVESEPELQAQDVDPAVDGNNTAAYTGQSRAVEPENTPAPVSRKLSKKEKRKLKKQATSEEPEKEQQEAEVPVAPVETKDNITVPQATLDMTEKPQDPTVTAEPIEAVKEEVPASQPELEPASMLEHEAGTSREPVDEALIQSANEDLKLATEPPKDEVSPLSKKLSKKEKRKKRKEIKTDESLPEPEQLTEPASLSEEQPYERFLGPGGVQETERQDEDAWPSIDWEKGKIDTVEQSSQSSPEAHAGAFVPEIPEFKESAIPEALLERPGETPEEATKESRAQTVTGTIDRDVTRQDFNMPTTGSALKTLHHVESRDEKKVEEPKPSKIANIFPNLERGLFRRPSPTQPVKDGAEEETMAQEASRDSAIQVLEAPIAREVEQQPEVKDSGYIASPALAQDDTFDATARELPNAKVVAESVPERQPEILEPKSQPAEQTTIPDPAEEDDVFGATSTRELPNLKTDFTSERQPEIPEPEEFRSVEHDKCELRRSPSIHGRHDHPPLPWSLDEPPQTQNARDISPPTQLPPIAEQEPERSVVRDGTPRLEMKPEHVLPRPETPVRKFTETALGRRAWPSPDKSDDDWEKIQKPSPKGLSPERGPRPESLKTPEQDKPVLRPSRPGSATSSTHSLRRVVHSASGDLRAAALAASPAVAPATEREHQSRPTTPQPSQAPTDLNVGEIASSSSYDPVTDKGKRPVRSMTDVYVSSPVIIH